MTENSGKRQQLAEISSKMANTQTALASILVDKLVELTNTVNSTDITNIEKALLSTFSVSKDQGGRTWQPFVGGKNGHENFRQVRIYNFRDKWVVFARNLKFWDLTQ